MVTSVDSEADIRAALLCVHRAGVARATTPDGVTCPDCGLRGLTPRGMWEHHPLYHIYDVRR
jgi:hypothetical protein